MPDTVPEKLKHAAPNFEAIDTALEVGNRSNVDYYLLKPRSEALLFKLGTLLFPHTWGEEDLVGSWNIHDQLIDMLGCLRVDLTIADCFVNWLPELQRELILDAEAMDQGDPASNSYDEVLLTYPGFKAITVHRIAHFLHSEGVPLLPRAMSEYAHSITGIDIHPGAQIGKSFCIDHGTGIVIGETTVIGDRVKVYQGVTLGALSVHKSLRTSKRHPTIESDVVIYANATILGGDTVIGSGSIIGGNVWITHSVAPQSKIYLES